MSRVIFVNEAVNALYRVANSGELQSRVGATRAVLMRVGRRGAVGPGAIGPGYYFTLETVLEGSGVDTPGTTDEEEANFPTSSPSSAWGGGQNEKIFALSKSWEKHFPEASWGIKELSLPLHICICPRNLLGSPATIKRAYAQLHLICLLF